MPESEDNLVEIYSASSSWEAEQICQALHEAGVAAEFTGEMLGGGAIGLPLGQATAPRVWVRRSQAEQARAVLQDLLSQGSAASSSWQQADEQAEATTSESEEEAAAEKVTRPIAILGTALNMVLGIAGLCLILISARIAWQNARLLNHYAGRATARLADPEAEARARRLAAHPDLEHETTYLYVVEGRPYHFTVGYGRQYPDRLAIHYQEESPGQIYRGHIMPPLLCMFLGLALGGSLLFFAWQFR